MNKPIDRTNSGLRDTLFEQLERLRDGTIDHWQAKAAADLAKEIISSIHVQLKFEEMKQQDRVPQHLSEMHLVPPLKKIESG